MAAAAEVADHASSKNSALERFNWSIGEQASFQNLKKLHLKERQDQGKVKETSVCDALKTKIQSENDPFKLKKLNDFLQTLPRNGE